MTSPSEPQVGERYFLVKATKSGEIACVRFERFRDGSGLAIADAIYVRMKCLDADRYAGGKILNSDEGETAWQALWDELRQDGFVPAAEARASGTLPADWSPPALGPGLRW